MATYVDIQKTTSMNIEEIREYCLSLPAVTEDFPFDDVNLVMRVCGKIFACLPLDNPDTVVLKCDADRAAALRESHSCITGAWHWNKKYWNQMPASQIETPLMRELIDHAYAEVVRKLPKKLRSTIVAG